MTNVSNEEKRHDFIVVGAGAAGSALAAELSASGAQVLVIESGGPDDAPTIMNPSIWFYNVGGPLDSTCLSPRCLNCTIASSIWPSVTYSAAAAALMPWCGRAACNVTSTGGLRTERKAGPSSQFLGREASPFVAKAEESVTDRAKILPC